jgi:GNAT superfamily N-acetyltransferase
MNTLAPTEQRPTFEVVRYKGDSHNAMADIRQLRALCWEKIYSAGYSLEDGFDIGALHWVAYVEGRVAGAARLTIHWDFNRLPNSHLFSHLQSAQISYPLAYISRLVVHPDVRRQGLAAHLDKLRIDAARNQGCTTMTVIWNPMSGECRRQQLLAIGFRSMDDETALPDGAFGNSYVYFLDFASDPVEHCS